MRAVVLGALVGAGLVMGAAGARPNRGDAVAQNMGLCRPAQADSGLIALSTVVKDGYQQLTVIDPKQMVISVYHIELASGAIELKCVRNIRWDLQVTWYNGKGLLPQEIQSLQQSR